MIKYHFLPSSCWRVTLCRAVTETIRRERCGKQDEAFRTTQLPDCVGQFKTRERTAEDFSQRLSNVTSLPWESAKSFKARRMTRLVPRETTACCALRNARNYKSRDDDRARKTCI
jgi:hypothetical protein